MMQSDGQSASSESSSLAPHTRSALRCRSAHLRIWLVALGGLIADLWSKEWAFERVTKLHRIIANVLSFQRSENPGALWGFGQGWTLLFIAASVVALLFVLYYFAKSDRGQHSIHLALGMVLAGALGNLHDRVFEGGKVRDFIKIELKIGGLELWPWVFNVADILLVCGVVILLLNIWFERHGPPPIPSEAAGSRS